MIHFHYTLLSFNLADDCLLEVPTKRNTYWHGFMYLMLYGQHGLVVVTRKAAVSFDEPQVAEPKDIGFPDGPGCPGKLLSEVIDELLNVGDENHSVLPPQGYDTETNNVYCA